MMKIFYKICYINNNRKTELLIADIKKAKYMYKILKLNNKYKNVKFYIVNQSQIEMKYEELFEK